MVATEIGLLKFFPQGLWPNDEWLFGILWVPRNAPSFVCTLANKNFEIQDEVSICNIHDTYSALYLYTWYIIHYEPGVMMVIEDEDKADGCLKDFIT